MLYIVAHAGVPIGTVDLPDGRRWAGGLLVPFPAFAAVRDVVAAASVAGVEAAVDVLMLPDGETLDVSALDRATAAAVQRLTALTFELRDEAGLRVPADVVRLADPGDGRGVRVRAFFARSSSGTLAFLRTPPLADGWGEAPGA